MANVILLPTARAAFTQAELFLGAGEAQTQEQAAESLSLRLAAQALRNEQIRASLENLHSVRGLAARRGLTGTSVGSHPRRWKVVTQ